MNIPVQLPHIDEDYSSNHLLSLERYKSSLPPEKREEYYNRFIIFMKRQFKNPNKMKDELFEMFFNKTTDDFPEREYFFNEIKNLYTIIIKNYKESGGIVKKGIIQNKGVFHSFILDFLYGNKGTDGFLYKCFILDWFYNNINKRIFGSGFKKKLLSGAIDDNYIYQNLIKLLNEYVKACKEGYIPDYSELYNETKPTPLEYERIFNLPTITTANLSANQPSRFSRVTRRAYNIVNQFRRTRRNQHSPLPIQTGIYEPESNISSLLPEAISIHPRGGKNNHKKTRRYRRNSKK